MKATEGRSKYDGATTKRPRSDAMKTIAVIGGLLVLTAAAQNAPHEDSFRKEMHATMQVMDRGMTAAPMLGDVDHDFAAMMIPHHQGAIDMAKSELKYGTDPVMRRLAQEILVDQQSEIVAMQLWLDKRAARREK
ncbi:DUF305 domain-containing protein [Paludibaculum fermentans]|uniref:DUF305 domain-containing protein n=2 Tax=Paludibaculum fermentans TaxID=1473598 RepID=A0A7S7SJE2_PALFE|nr:DUF305 domain-containing protein [Paludibaculum fermentans]